MIQRHDSLAKIATYVLLWNREREEMENADRVANMECDKL